MAFLRSMVRCNRALCHRTFGRGRSYQCMSGWHCDSGVQEHRCVLSGLGANRIQNSNSPLPERLQGLLLILFTESLKIGLAVRIERLLAALLPGRFKFGRCDVPVRSAFAADSTQVLAELFDRGSSEEPVAIVDLVNDKTGLQHNRVRNHGIVDRIGVFGNVEILLNDAPRIGEKRPVSSYSATIFVRLGDIVGADRDQPAIANLHLAMELQQTFCLTAIFWAEAAAAKDEHHGILSL